MPKQSKGSAGGSAGHTLKNLTLRALAALALIVSRTQAQVLRGNVDQNSSLALEDATKEAVAAISNFAINKTDIDTVAEKNTNLKFSTNSSMAEERQLGSGATPTFQYPVDEKSFYDYATNSGSTEQIPRLGSINFGKQIQAGVSFGLVVQNTNKLVIEYSDDNGNWLRINYINPPIKIRNHPETSGTIGGFMTASFKEGIFLIASHGKFLTEKVSMGPTRGKGSLLLKLEKWNYDGAPVIDVADPNPSQGSNYWYEAPHGYDGGKTYDFNKNYWGAEQIEWKSQDTGFNLGYVDSEGHPLRDAKSRHLQQIIEGLKYVRIGTPRGATVSLVRSTLDAGLGIDPIPTKAPSKAPTRYPTPNPTRFPATRFPTQKPTGFPTTARPTKKKTKGL